jgi:hypothetical protein
MTRDREAPAVSAALTAIAVLETDVILLPIAGTSEPLEIVKGVAYAAPPVPSVTAVPAIVRANPVRVSVPARSVPPVKDIVDPDPVIDIVPVEASSVPDETPMDAAVAPVSDSVALVENVPPCTDILADAPDIVVLFAPAAHVPEFIIIAAAFLFVVKASFCVHVPLGAVRVRPGVRVMAAVVIVCDPLPSNVMPPVPVIVMFPVPAKVSDPK